MDTLRRSIETEVSEAGNGCYRAVCRLIDPFHEIKVVLLIRSGSLTIVEASAEMIRIPYGDRCPNSLRRISNLTGVRVRPGLNSTIREAVGGDCGCPYLVELVAQACQFTLVTSKSEEARNTILVQNNLERFAEIHDQMGECAGHQDLPLGRLPDWLEQEHKQKKVGR